MDADASVRGPARAGPRAGRLREPVASSTLGTLPAVAALQGDAPFTPFDGMLRLRLSNLSAAGAPTVRGTAQVGETLTVDTSGIADADGLTPAAFARQRLADDMEIIGATSSTHTLTSGEQGKTLKLRVTFSDDAGDEETLTGAATEALAAAPFPLTARASRVPASHNGQDAFTFELRFSEEPEDDFSYRTLRDHAFTVTGGQVVKAWRRTTTAPAQVPPASSRPAAPRRATSPGPGEQRVTNRPATGAPTISGTAQVGETLTASTSGIADADGLDNVSYSYQWTALGSDIDGATGSAYTLAEADEGKTIRVKVSFTDDRSNQETLTSAATSAVAAAPVPLTVSLENAATTHAGQTPFTFDLRFSEEFELSYVTLRDHAFTVAGGTVTKSRRLDRPSNVRWEITVVPDSNGDVTIVLPVTTNCDDQGAICTEDGRKLSNSLNFTVSGPGG